MTDAATEPQPKTLRYMPGPVALAAHRSKAQVKLAWGPLGTAKTTWLCWRAKAICERAAKGGFSARILFLRDTYRNLIDSTFVTWCEWFPPDTACGYKAHSDPMDYKLNVGGRYHDILFRHAQTEQDASMFLSTEYDAIMLEEIAPAYIPGRQLISPGIAEGVFDMAISRLTRKLDRAAVVRPEVCMTCNPPPLNHWASKRIVDKSQEYLNRANWAHFYFDANDNMVNLRPDYYSNLETAWEGKRTLIQRFIKGQRLPVFVGIPRFNLDQLDRMTAHAQEPGFRGLLRDTTDNPLHIRLEANDNGYVKIWVPPEIGAQYVLGADVAEGVEDGAYSAAYVIRRDDCQIVAAWHGHLEPEMYGDELARLGMLYNNAILCVEVNNHGLTTLTRLKNLHYDKIFYSQNLLTRGKKQERIGFQTTSHTKPVIIDGIGSYLDVEKGQPDPVILDAGLINELQTYGIMDNGTTGPQEGCFSDRVIGFGLALYVSRFAGISRHFPSAKR